MYVNSELCAMINFRSSLVIASTLFGPQLPQHDWLLFGSLYLSKAQNLVIESLD